MVRPGGGGGGGDGDEGGGGDPGGGGGCEGSGGGGIPGWCLDAPAHKGQAGTGWRDAVCGKNPCWAVTRDAFSASEGRYGARPIKASGVKVGESALAHKIGTRRDPYHSSQRQANHERLNSY
eukprot:COSAG05_NODE_3019_length_2410_cov_3.049329_2_plen_122_part_00